MTPPSNTEVVADAIDLNQPDLYFNRHMSLLRFNRRVLEQAKDESMPLLERLRFLCISSTNMDEFFEIRVAGLIQHVESGATQTGPDLMDAREVLRTLSVEAHLLVDEQYRVLNEVLIPRLDQENIRFIKRGDWSAAREKWLRKFFKEQLLPVLSPMGLDPAHPFPRIMNKSLNFIVSLSGKDAFGRSGGYAIVQAPRSLPRLIELPNDDEQSGVHDFVFLSSIIHANVEDLFPGMKVTGCYQFRVTRNSDLFVDEEEIDDLLRAMEGELASRRYGDEVRLEVAHDCPDAMVSFLARTFELPMDNVYQVNGPVNLNRLFAVCELADRSELRFPSFTPGRPVELAGQMSMFEAIQAKDILLHHPFESFLPVVEFLKQAANDPDVLAIKQTLYRTGPKSAIVDALVDAAQAGKEVTVVIELRARFDEAENIGLATRLQEAGAHVLYGIVGYKTHAKMIMVVRREGANLRRYVHLGTGNYHPRTARIYTDYGLFSCDPEIGDDVHQVFLQLTSLGKVSKLNKLLQSPFTLHKTLLKKIQREIEFAQAGKETHIVFKINALTDKQVIQALYQASIAGVQVELVVRGMCCLRPGVPGVSENIRVRSVVGRFLEHTRIYSFHNDGKPEIYCASADCMERNFFRRVETCFPIEQRTHRKRVMRELNFYLQDNRHAWLLDANGDYTQATANDDDVHDAQRSLLESLAESY